MCKEGARQVSERRAPSGERAVGFSSVSVLAHDPERRTPPSKYPVVQRQRASPLLARRAVRAARPHEGAATRGARARRWRRPRRPWPRRRCGRGTERRRARTRHAAHAARAAEASAASGAARRRSAACSRWRMGGRAGLRTGMGTVCWPWAQTARTQARMGHATRSWRQSMRCSPPMPNGPPRPPQAARLPHSRSLTSSSSSASSRVSCGRCTLCARPQACLLRVPERQVWRVWIDPARARGGCASDTRASRRPPSVESACRQLTTQHGRAAPHPSVALARLQAWARVLASRPGASAGGWRAGTYEAHGGFFAEEAVDLLRDFYVMGNPRAPRPHRPKAPAVVAATGAPAGDE